MKNKNKLLEEIAKLINHGLDDREIAKRLALPATLGVGRLVGVIRHLMTKKTPTAPERCPKCRGDIEQDGYSEVEICDNEAQQAASCLKGHRWLEVYTFDRIVHIKD